jgi:biopolymer transport protein ExbD
MSTWRVRHEGSPTAVELPSGQRVLEGLRDGDWDPTDEVRGPADPVWVAIEDHPTFAEAVADMEPPPAPHPDETKLDMNPLIDVALVLLIFFILTATYTTLRRSIELPPEPPEEKGQKTQVVKFEDIKDRSFKVKIWMEGNEPRIKIEDKGVTLDELDREIAEFVRTTGRRELYADVAPEVPWGIEARLYDAAKGADIHQIYWPKGR